MSEISSVSSPGEVPSKTLPSSFPGPTVFSKSRFLQPQVNQIEGCCANKVIINLSTALVIPDYSLYYEGPISSFQPTFYGLDDGSLVAPPFISDLYNANIGLLVIGMLTMLFARNIIVSGDYLRRVKVKRKILFYILFISQMLAPICLIPVIMSSFDQNIDCTTVIILACVAGTVSLALLITGVLGVKAYKCLNNSRIVLVILGLFQLSSSAVVSMDVAITRGERRLAGSCIRVSDLFYTQIFVCIQLVETLFICCCFLYACWKSRGSKSARGRISIQLSLEDLPIEVPEDKVEEKPTLRGWRDYVLDERIGPASPPPSPGQPASKSKSTFSTLVDRTIIPRRLSMLSPSSAMNWSKAAVRGKSPPPSSLSRFGHLVPNVHLLQQVIKDELLYTTFTTATCVVVAVLAIVGLNVTNGLTVTGWIALNWAIFSLLAIHSFGRVVRRHERDAIRQHPSTVVRTGTAMIEKKSPESLVSTCPSHYLREAGDDDADDPFADTQRLGSGDPLDSISIESRSPDPFADNPSQQPALANPSSNFPASGRSTPCVAHQGFNGPVQGLSGKPGSLNEAQYLPWKRKVKPTGADELSPVGLTQPINYCI